MDERLMQVVGNFASMLQSDPSTARRQLLPKPLSITPLGPSMGLIQWVDHTMPLYGVYKAWQQRQAADKAGMHAALSQLASEVSLFIALKGVHGRAAACLLQIIATVLRFNLEGLSLERIKHNCVWPSLPADIPWTECYRDDT